MSLEEKNYILLISKYRAEISDEWQENEWDLRIW